ncbi:MULTISPECIES: GNAT family N-acetyltransferase [Deinococcus]|uniref:GNAT family N-acetyltransferase n=1 Tax=Deinococcus cavernae TaxID=2320857 RepID=A0A418V543_9DEIO|nr:MULTISPECIES: GNAT family N-acetyltransferase [Deinococcus]RJF71212.1 GNAT family N-acetyltransferase [Deinococcus cavernae]
MTTTTVNISPFDPMTAPDSQKLAVGQLLADAYAFAYPDDPPLLPEKEALSLTHLTPGERAEHFVIWDGLMAKAWGSLSFDTTQNLHVAHARLFVHPRCRREGLATALRGELEQVARREGRSTVTFGTSSRAPAGEAFAQQLHAQPALPMKVSRLDIPSVSQELLRAWQVRPANDPYTLHVWTRIPEAHLERMADMMMVMNTAPKGDLDMEDWVITPEMIRAWEGMIAEAGEVRYLMAVEDSRSGQLDGYTEVFWDAERSALVYQGATAVRPAARGLGLGKWLKAAMLRHVQEHCPGARWIRTNNANVNEAMLGINVSMGFEPWAQFTEWQLKLPQ